ncbi:hypothetical protein [Pseudomonas nitroreducens]|uniref:hypothetical protein n=1 Tax=Pseudomonas nitroreducens TaxID=46680 RepID=UPI00351D74F7
MDRVELVTRPQNGSTESPTEWTREIEPGEHMRTRVDFFDRNVTPKLYGALGDLFDRVDIDAELRTLRKVAKLLADELPQEDWSEDDIMEWLTDTI